ncbi:30S ribosomal protein S8 [Salinisphaera orenii]|nr:30S ribosomal protein S8 [Salinisphaera halophila]
MSMTDPIADMLTRIRNGQSADKESVEMPSSKLKLAIAGVLESEGYVAGYETGELDGKPRLKIRLKYFQGHGVIENIERVSKPGLRVYRSKGDIPSVVGGLGICIVSTSQGVMTDRAAREAGHGGELLCTVS